MLKCLQSLLPAVYQVLIMSGGMLRAFLTCYALTVYTRISVLHSVGAGRCLVLHASCHSMRALSGRQACPWLHLLTPAPLADLAGCTQGIDYASIHLWQDNWERTDLDFARFWLLNHTAQATTLQKPLVLEEFGKEVNSSGTGAAHMAHLFGVEVLWALLVPFQACAHSLAQPGTASCEL